MSTHIEFAHMCNNNFCAFNLNYVTEMHYLPYFINYKYIVISFDGGYRNIFHRLPPLDPKNNSMGGGCQYSL